MTTLPPSNPALRDLILKAQGKIIDDNQKKLAEDRVFLRELRNTALNSTFSGIDDFLSGGDEKYDRSIKSADEKYLTDEDLIQDDDMVSKVTLEVKKENSKKAIFFIRSANRQIEKGERVLMNIRVKKEENKGEILPNLTEAENKVRAKLEKLKQDLDLEIHKNSEAYTLYHAMQLREWRKQMTNGKIVETESVHKSRLRVEESMREGRPVFLKGPPGTGKTELAKHVAEIIYKDKQKITPIKKEVSSQLEFVGTGFEKPVLHEKSNIVNGGNSFGLVSCNRDMQYSELAGNKSIKTNENGMETSFDYGPMYNCMEKGIPLIMDEVNALPAETLLKINEYLTRKPGDIIRVQENGGKEIKIASGFCFVFTGNVGANYQGRFRLESSFNNRMGLILDYDYVPNASGVTDKLEDKDGKVEGNIVSCSELWHIMLAGFMNSKGIMQMPEGDIEKMWNMSKAIRRCQDVFSGTATDFTMPNASGDNDDINTISQKVKNSPISMRNVQDILGEYTKNPSMPLDYHIMQKLIIEKTDENSREVYLTIFKSFGFFSSNSGCEYKVDAGKVKISIDEKKLKESRENKKDIIYSSRDTVRLAFGSASEIQESEILEIERRIESKMSPEDRENRLKQEQEKLRLEQIERDEQEEKSRVQAEVSDPLKELNKNDSSPIMKILSNYDTQKGSLVTLGLLDSSGSYTVDGISYTYPTQEEVKNRLEQMDQVILEKKMSQGFTRLHITPNGLPYQKYIDTLVKLTKEKAVKKIVSRAEKYYLIDNEGNEIEFNPKNPLYKWDGHDSETWTTNGVSEIQHTKSTKGFDISLLEDNLSLPRENTKQVIGDRVRIEANKTPNQYLELLNEANQDPSKPNYKVSGISRQELITLYINNLNVEGTILDNYLNNKTSVSYAISSKKDSVVAMLCWAAPRCRWYVYRPAGSDRVDAESVRVSVRV